MIARTPATRTRRRHDSPHSVPTPAVVRRRQRAIRAGWTPADAEGRLQAPKITGDPAMDAMLSFLQMLAGSGK